MTKRLLQTHVPEFDPHSPWLLDVEPRPKPRAYTKHPKCAVVFCRRASAPDKRGLCKEHCPDE